MFRVVPALRVPVTAKEVEVALEKLALVEEAVVAKKEVLVALVDVEFTMVRLVMVEVALLARMPPARVERDVTPRVELSWVAPPTFRIVPTWDAPEV